MSSLCLSLVCTERIGGKNGACGPASKLTVHPTPLFSSFLFTSAPPLHLLPHSNMETPFPLRIKELLNTFRKTPTKVSELSEENTESEEEKKYSASIPVGKREKLKVKLSTSAHVSSQLSNSTCQVENCRGDLKEAKQYYRRHKICEDHSKAPFVLTSGLAQRFCLQCSRLHTLEQFDDNKRSCRSRLAGHNERRRSRNHEFGEDNLRHKRARPQLDEVMAVRMPKVEQSTYE